MRFLADESCDFGIVVALRMAGHEVVAISESFPRSQDKDVIRKAVREGRILLTEDKDFGQICFASMSIRGSVVLLRYPAKARGELAQDVVRLANRHGKKLKHCFVVMQPRRVRITRFR